MNRNLFSPSHHVVFPFQMLALFVLVSIIGCSAQQNASLPIEIAPVQTSSCPNATMRETIRRDIRNQVQTRLGLPTFQPPCSGANRGAWYRIANLNMSDPSQQCPQGLRQTSFSKRTCGSTTPNSQVGRCDSTTFSVNNTEYTQVCGRIIGYKYYQTAAFFSYYGRSQTTVESSYVDGLSLTHGAAGQREHIWTFAGSISDVGIERNRYGLCPCTSYMPIPTPPFVGNDYFCESGTNDPNSDNIAVFYPNDPLWDGQDCGGPNGTTCCAFNTPPWFTKTLPNPTTDDIELRLCSNSHFHSNTPIEIVELYIR